MAERFDPKKVKLAASVEHPGTLYCLCYDHEGRRLYGAGSDRAVYSVDLVAEKPAAEKKWSGHDNYVSAMAFLGAGLVGAGLSESGSVESGSRGGVVITAGYDGRLIWTEAESGTETRRLDAHAGWVRDLALFSDGRRLATAGDDMLVKLWDAETGELLGTFEGHAKQTPQGYNTALYAVAVAPDGKTIASGDRIGEIRLWETETGKLLGRLKAPAFYTYDPVKRVRSIGGIRALAFSPDGSRLAVGGIGQVTNVDGFVGPCRVEVWDPQSGKQVFVGQDSHNAVFNHVAFFPDLAPREHTRGNSSRDADQESGVRSQKSEDGAEQSKDAPSASDAPSKEPLWLIAGGGGDGGGLLAFWDQSDRKPTHKAKPKGHVQQFVLDPPGDRLFTAGYGGFQIWNLAGAEVPDEKDQKAKDAGQ